MYWYNKELGQVDLSLIERCSLFGQEQSLNRGAITTESQYNKTQLIAADQDWLESRVELLPSLSCLLHNTSSEQRVLPAYQPVP